jgi:hypothetical protein
MFRRDPRTPHPSTNGESGYSIEVFNALGDTIAVTAVPESALEPLHKNEVLSRARTRSAIKRRELTIRCPIRQTTNLPWRTADLRDLCYRARWSAACAHRANRLISAKRHLAVECDSASSLNTEVEAGRGIALVTTILETL